MILKHFAASLVMEVIDHLTQMSLILAFLVHLVHLFLQGIHKWVHQSMIYENIVASDAELACVNKGRRGNLVGCEVNIGAFVNDERTLAAKLQYAWNQILAGSLSNQLTLLRASRHDYLVKQSI